MHRVVEGMNDVVRRAGVLGIPAQHFLREGAGAHVGRDVAHRLAQRHEGEGVERERLVVGGIGGGELLHRRGEEGIAAGLGPSP